MLIPCASPSLPTPAGEPVLRKDQSFRQGKQKQGLGSPHPCWVFWGAAGPWWTQPHTSAALLGGDTLGLHLWGRTVAVPAEGQPGLPGTVWWRTCPWPHPAPAYQGHHEGDCLAGVTATTGDIFHHQEMLVSQHLSSGKEKKQQWRKAGTQLGTLLIN